MQKRSKYMVIKNKMNIPFSPPDIGEEEINEVISELSTNSVPVSL